MLTRFVPALSLLALVGCGSGGDDIFVVGPEPELNAAPTVEVTSPAGATALRPGDTFEATFTDDDPDDVAVTSLFLDGDGVFATHADQYVIQANILELDGTPQFASFTWDAFETPAGTYWVLAVTSDGTNPPTIAVAPSLVTLVDVSWARRAGGTATDRGIAISSFSDGSCVVTGAFGGKATFGLGEANATPLVSDGELDAFVARYNPDGTLAWAKRAGGTDFDAGYGISSLADGSCVVTGYFSGASTFGAGEANETPLVSDGLFDVFVARYDAGGTLAWAKRAGGTIDDRGTGISSFADGSCVVTGLFEGTVTFGAGEANETPLVSDGLFDVFAARYDAGGTLAWAKRAGGTSFDQSNGISSFADGSSVITGFFDGTATFGAGEANATPLVSDGDFEVFVARYDADGTLAWAERAGGTVIDRGSGISSFADGSCGVTGEFSGTATFGAGEVNETSLVAGGNDVFVARFNADGTLAWVKPAEGGRGNGISALTDGSCVVTGVIIANTATFGAGEANETLLVSDGNFDVFVARYDADGTLAWVERAGGTAPEVGVGISSLADGSVLVTGLFFGAATFGAGDANETTLQSSVGSEDVFVARFNADGGF